VSVDRIKKPKTNRYPSLAGTDPKFRRNHRHALHGTMRALVRPWIAENGLIKLTSGPEGGQGREARSSIVMVK